MSWDCRKPSLSAEWKKNQCCGSGSGRIVIILPDTDRDWYTEPPDKDPYSFQLKEKINKTLYTASVVDPDPVGSESFCRIGIGIQGQPIRI